MFKRLACGTAAKITMEHELTTMHLFKKIDKKATKNLNVRKHESIPIDIIFSTL